MDDPTQPERSPDGSPTDDHRATHEAPTEPRSGRPLVERIGMAAIALLMAMLFGVVAVAAFVGGELFLAAMGALGCLMTLWVGAMTLLRG